MSRPPTPALLYSLLVSESSGPQERLAEGQAAATSAKKSWAACHTGPTHVVLFSGLALTKEMAVTPRLNPFVAAPAPMQKWLDFSKGILQIGLEESLMELVEIRASQINGCAACLHMHTAAARKRGESEERLYLLDAWRESPLYSARERAALAWTEALTLVSETHAPDEAYQALQAQFTPEEQVALTLLIVTINGWNRVQIGFRGVHPVAKREAA
jgi:AhpD family alkylhydroperoxidase